MKHIFKWGVVLVLAVSSVAQASYQSVLKEWSRSDKAFTADNLEMRLAWEGTYLGAEFREARRSHLARLLEWTEPERASQLRQDERELQSFDEFFVSVYAGSGAYPEIGKDTGNWRIALQVGGQLISPLSLERVRITEVERGLYPYLNHWSKAYRIRFPKTVEEGVPFSLKMMGIPARSELRWTK